MFELAWPWMLALLPLPILVWWLLPPYRVRVYFNNSYPRMLAYFAREQKLSQEELNEILEIIKSRKK